MTERNSFEKDTNYNSSSGFSRVKFGIDRPILEVELNEMQKIQEEKRTSVTRQIVPTGFLELIKRDFNGVGIEYNPTVTTRSINSLGDEEISSYTALNSIAISPCRLVVNGNEVELEGTEEINGVKGYTLIHLAEPPVKSSSTTDIDLYDFVFLEIWFEEITSLSTIHKNGFLEGTILDNNLIDDRVGDETSRRVTLKHKIRIQNNIDLKKWNNGFGYDSKTGDYSSIYAQGPLNNTILDNDFIFMKATNDDFKGTSFYGDFGLYVAGRPNSPGNNGSSKVNEKFGVLENYIFAVPLFGIKRRNKDAYSLTNPNGGILYIDNTSKSDRPDGLFNNMVDSKDLIDLRKSISFGHLNTAKMLDTNLKKLMTGNLNTNVNDKMMRAQFGLLPTNTANTDYSNNAILHLDFSNQSLLPKLGSSPTTNGGDINYHLSAIGYGLSLDGKIIVEYPITNDFDVNKGTIEFLIKPYWDGADENISQTIFSVMNESNLPLIQLVKDKNELILTQKYNGSGDSLQSQAIVDLADNPMYNNEIYHIRLTWYSDNASNNTTIYLNGKEVSSSGYTASMLTPQFLKLGTVETVNSYSSDLVGCLIDEFIIYNKVLSPDNFPQISGDIASGEAKIYNSFNSKLTGFQDNEHQQSIISAILTSLDDTTFTLVSPYGTKVVYDNAKVYSALTGRLYTGEWTAAENDNATFTLTSTPDGNTKFSGETLWVTHDILIPGGLGIKDVPTKILDAKLNDVKVSFADISVGKRIVGDLGDSGISTVTQDGTISDYINIDSYIAYDYSSSTRDSQTTFGKFAFARLVECAVKSNGTNIYKVPKTLFGRDVLGIKYVDQPLSTCYKEDSVNGSGDFVIELVNELQFDTTFKVEIALGGFTFDYQTQTKSLISNMMKATTIVIPTTGNQKDYIIPASRAISSTITSVPNGGIVSAFLNLNGKDKNRIDTDFGQSVFITGSTQNYFAAATVTGIGTPFITISFKETPITGHNIEIPVLITYQPLSTELLSVWYEYSPYQGILTDKTEKSLKRLSDWKVFATTFGSGKIITDNIRDKSINNASNRLPGGQNFSYLLDGKDINFVTEQFSITSKYSVNKKLMFRTQFTELIKDNDFDSYTNLLTTEFTMKKQYGKNYQDAFIESSISDIGFAIQDTIDPISKYLGATCLVVDEEGNVLLLIIGEIIKDPTIESIIRPVHGDLFRLEGNPIIISRN